MASSFHTPVINEFVGDLSTYCGSGISHVGSMNECLTPPNGHLHYQHQLSEDQSVCATKSMDNDLQLLLDFDPNIVDFIDGTITTPTDPKVSGLPPITGGLVPLYKQ